MAGLDRGCGAVGRILRVAPGDKDAEGQRHSGRESKSEREVMLGGNSHSRRRSDFGFRVPMRTDKRVKSPRKKSNAIIDKNRGENGPELHRIL